MAQIRSTRYVCDRCESDVPRKRDLVRYHVRRANNWDTESAFDLCELCVPQFVAEVANNVGEEDAARLLP